MMKIKTTISILFFIALITMISVISCSKQSEDRLQALTPTPCDTTSVSYSNDIIPILQNNCYSCHGNGNTAGSGGILIDGYANLDKWAANGYLVGNVTHAPGYVPMPYGLPALPDCEINKIVAWVHQGALNN
jgi:hypothetical protein